MLRAAIMPGEPKRRAFAASAAFVNAALALMLVAGCARASGPPPRESPPADAQLVSFTAADGAQLHGFIYLPPGPGRHPAVL